MIALRIASRTLAALILGAGCAPRPAPVAPAAAAPVQARARASGGAERTACPRVERSARMWTGFLVDVPSDTLGRAVEVVVPIQVALGELFCAPERVDCRPFELRAIDLQDAQADVAQLRVGLMQVESARELSLTLRLENGAWVAQPVGLARYLALCREEPAPSAEEVR